MIQSALIATHFVLFSVKLWAVVLLMENFKKYTAMAILSTSYLIIQVWFICCFFLDIDLYYYEIVSILDQCVLTIWLVFYLIKEVSWQKDDPTAEEYDQNDL